MRELLDFLYAVVHLAAAMVGAGFLIPVVAAATLIATAGAALWYVGRSLTTPPSLPPSDLQDRGDADEDKVGKNSSENNKR